jgi:hypothetical protein
MQRFCVNVSDLKGTEAMDTNVHSFETEEYCNNIEMYVMYRTVFQDHDFSASTALQEDRETVLSKQPLPILGV